MRSIRNNGMELMDKKGQTTHVIIGSSGAGISAFAEGSDVGRPTVHINLHTLTEYAEVVGRQGKVLIANTRAGLSNMELALVKSVESATGASFIFSDD